MTTIEKELQLYKKAFKKLCVAWSDHDCDGWSGEQAPCYFCERANSDPNCDICASLVYDTFLELASEEKE